MIIWSGFGFVVPIIYFGVGILMEAMLEGFFHDTTFYQTRPWGVLLTDIISGGLIFFASSLLGMRQGRTVIDKQTGEEFDLKPSDSFFFIPIFYWSFIAVAVGICFAIAIAINGKS